MNQYKNSIASLNHYYLKTIHHEFTHIMNQTKEMPTAYQFITGNSYVADKWSESPYNAGYLKRGFISSYAQMEHGEDFAEMLSLYVVSGIAVASVDGRGRRGRRFSDKLQTDSGEAIHGRQLEYRFGQIAQQHTTALSRFGAGRIDLNDLTLK